MNWKKVERRNKIFSDYVERVSGTSLTQRGAPVLIDSRDHMYTVNRIHSKSNKTVWECRYKRKLKCRARCSAANGLILKFDNEHNHDPPAQNQGDESE